MRWRRGTIEGLAFLLFAGHPHLGKAADDPEALIRQGNDLRRAGDDVRAEGYLKRAYELNHTPRSAAQFGLVEFALGKFADANLFLTEALATSDAWVDRNREVVEASREESALAWSASSSEGARRTLPSLSESRLLGQFHWTERSGWYRATSSSGWMERVEG